jgi:hypothetical protein
VSAVHGCSVENVGMKMSCPLTFVGNADPQTYDWSYDCSHHDLLCCDALPGHHLKERNKFLLTFLMLKLVCPVF